MVIHHVSDEMSVEQRWERIVSSNKTFRKRCFQINEPANISSVVRRHNILTNLDCCTHEYIARHILNHAKSLFRPLRRRMIYPLMIC